MEGFSPTSFGRIARRYVYLIDSIRRFPDAATLARMLTAAGFEAVTYRHLTGGIAAIHTGRAQA